MTLSLMRVRRLMSATLRPASRRARASVSPMLKPQTSLRRTRRCPRDCNGENDQARTRGAMTAPLRPRYLGLANGGEPGTRGGGLPERPGMSRENRGFRPQATRVASKAGRSSADEPAGCGRTRRRDFAPLMPTVICSGHCFELVERLADKLRPVSLARLAGRVFVRALEDSDPRHGRLRHGCADLCRGTGHPLGRRVAAVFDAPAGGALAGAGSVLLLPDLLGKPLRDGAADEVRVLAGLLASAPRHQAGAPGSRGTHHPRAPTWKKTFRFHPWPRSPTMARTAPGNRWRSCSGRATPRPTPRPTTSRSPSWPWPRCPGTCGAGC